MAFLVQHSYVRVPSVFLLSPLVLDESKSNYQQCVLVNVYLILYIQNLSVSFNHSIFMISSFCIILYILFAKNTS